LVDRFLPRIAFGKAVATSGESAVMPGSSQDTKGFAYLKRDLVRLLGTICYERKDIQNRIRECGGIQVVMNLCVIDERNPCE
jgi:ataxin-10